MTAGEDTAGGGISRALQIAYLIQVFRERGQADNRANAGPHRHREGHPHPVARPHPLGVRRGEAGQDRPAY